MSSVCPSLPSCKAATENKKEIKTHTDLCKGVFATPLRAGDETEHLLGGREEAETSTGGWVDTIPSSLLLGQGLGEAVGLDVGYFGHLGEGGEGKITREGILGVRFVYKPEKNTTTCGTATDHNICGIYPSSSPLGGLQRNTGDLSGSLGGSGEALNFLDGTSHIDVPLPIQTCNHRNVLKTRRHTYWQLGLRYLNRHHG